MAAVPPPDGAAAPPRARGRAHDGDDPRDRDLRRDLRAYRLSVEHVLTDDAGLPDDVHTPRVRQGRRVRLPRDLGDGRVRDRLRSEPPESGAVKRSRAGRILRAAAIGLVLLWSLGP